MPIALLQTGHSSRCVECIPRIVVVVDGTLHAACIEGRRERRGDGRSDGRRKRRGEGIIAAHLAVEAKTSQTAAKTTKHRSSAIQRRRQVGIETRRGSGS